MMISKEEENMNNVVNFSWRWIYEKFCSLFWDDDFTTYGWIILSSWNDQDNT